ncbi:hypothetical protein ABIE19_002967 [Brevundimonas faecalis]|uniref:Uncharacterized protein n=1 Tax=Brevundimonas faecalis TaxID=947378 RepID=A0ABV2RGA2_9CAUL
MKPPRLSGSLRELVPTPPLKPKAMVPVPAPTAPCSTGPGVAVSIARTTSAAVTTRARISLRPPSLVSPTTALTERMSSCPGWFSVQSRTPSIPRATDRVFVRTIGVSISPSSLIWVAPASLPKPLATDSPAGTLSRNRSPPCGRTAVTPVRTLSPERRVTWPTRTPATSVTAFKGPGVRIPGARPRSRIVGRADDGSDAVEGAAISVVATAVVSAAAARREREAVMIGS